MSPRSRWRAARLLDQPAPHALGDRRRAVGDAEPLQRRCRWVLTVDGLTCAAGDLRPGELPRAARAGTSSSRADNSFAGSPRLTRSPAPPARTARARLPRRSAAARRRSSGVASFSSTPAAPACEVVRAAGRPAGEQTRAAAPAVIASSTSSPVRPRLHAEHGKSRARRAASSASVAVLRADQPSLAARHDARFASRISGWPSARGRAGAINGVLLRS